MNNLLREVKNEDFGPNFRFSNTLREIFLST
jgi:hypothetical protein